MKQAQAVAGRQPFACINLVGNVRDVTRAGRPGLRGGRQKDLRRRDCSSGKGGGGSSHSGATFRIRKVRVLFHKLDGSSVPLGRRGVKRAPGPSVPIWGVEQGRGLWPFQRCCLLAFISLLPLLTLAVVLMLDEQKSLPNIQNALRAPNKTYVVV